MQMANIAGAAPDIKVCVAGGESSDDNEPTCQSKYNTRSNKESTAGHGGAWCHQCKALKTNTMPCDNLNCKAPCLNQFCDVCLHNHYGEGKFSII